MPARGVPSVIVRGVTYEHSDAGVASMREKPAPQEGRLSWPACASL